MFLILSCVFILNSVVSGDHSLTYPSTALSSSSFSFFDWPNHNSGEIDLFTNSACTDLLNSGCRKPQNYIDWSDFKCMTTNLKWCLMLPGNHIASLQSYFQPAPWPGIGMSDLANKRILSINSNPLQEVVSNVTLQSVWQMVKELSWGWGFFRALFILVYQGVTQNIKMVNPGLGHELRSSLSYLELKGQDPWREDTTNQHFKGEKAQSTLATRSHRPLELLSIRKDLGPTGPQSLLLALQLPPTGLWS